MPENGTDGAKQENNANLEEIRELSFQRRAEVGKSSLGGLYWFGRPAEDEDDLPSWWSERREWGLQEFWMKPGNDILQGAVASLVKKFKAMNWLLQGPSRIINRYQAALADEVDFGQGWSHSFGKVIQDYLTHDKGAFIELIGKGYPAGPINGPVLGIAHLDANLCQLTGDPVYPVIFNNSKTGKSHKLHATRVMQLTDMPSPNEAMNNVGFCAVSRVISSSQILLKLARYKNEKLSDLPAAGLLLLNNIMPTQWEDTKANYEQGRRRLNQQLWANIMTLFGLDPAQPVSAEFVSFANLPDQFNELEATNIYVNIIALAFGVDSREFWPVSQGVMSGTAHEVTIQAQKAKGKGIGDIISTVERAINWKILPPSVTFSFDFQDDDEDEQQANIIERKTKTIMTMWQPPSGQEQAAGAVAPVSRSEIRQMLADNIPYFKPDFLEVDMTDEVERSDTEREEEKEFGQMVWIDRKGTITRPRRLGQEKWVEIDTVLKRVEANYRAGEIDLDDLVEFRLGQLMDDRRDGDD
ncbi:MAG: hypothetical protein ACREIQ_09280 [Nitrospiria bacterium]